MVAEFEADLSRARTREGMKVARAKGRLRGKQPSSRLAKRPTLSPCTGPASTSAPSSPELFNGARSTVYRALERARQTTAATDAAA